MKVKRNLKIAFFFFFVMVCNTSCTKSFLNKLPLNQYSSETFWTDESDVQLALVGVYAQLLNGNDGLGNAIVSWDGASDDCYWNPTSGIPDQWTLMELGQINSQSGGPISNCYDNYYSDIAQCNYFLANVGRAGMSAALTNSYSAEVRTLRAYFYFQLTTIYGGVILTLQPEGVAETHPPKATQAQVVAQIEADLTFAIANLTNTTLEGTSPGYTGRVIKGTAQGLLAKVQLFNGEFQDAAKTAASLINDPTNPFQLATDYRGLFCKNVNFGGGQRASNINQEVMLSVRYQTGTSLTHSFDLIRGYNTGYSALQPINNLIDSYECTDGLPTSSSPLYDPSNPYNNRDPRMDYTSYVPGQPWPEGKSTPSSPAPLWTANTEPSATGFMLRKGLDETRAPYSNSTISDQDFIILRYAEVLLIYAEAQNEVSGPDATVYSAVNKVRARPGVNMPPLPVGLDQAGMRTAIRNERRWEFALEGMRYFDLLRWKTAATVLPAIVNPGGNSRVFNPNKNYLMPFPQDEIDKNGAYLQNPGY